MASIRNLRIQPPDRVAGEVRRGGGIVRSSDRRKLIRLAVEDRPVEPLEVIVPRDHLALEAGEELRVAGEIVVAEVVGLVHDPTAEQPGPDPVGDRAGEPGVLRPDQPVGEDPRGSRSVGIVTDLPSGKTARSGLGARGGGSSSKPAASPARSPPAG